MDKFTAALKAYRFAGRKYAINLMRWRDESDIEPFKKMENLPEEDYRSLRKRFGVEWSAPDLYELEDAYRCAFNGRICKSKGG